MLDDMREFFAVFKRLEPSLRNRIAHRGKNREDADDLLQNLLIRGWEKRHTLRLETLPAWFFTVTDHLLIDELRQSSKGGISIYFSQEELLEEEACSYNSRLDEQVEHKELQATLNDFLRQLPEQTSSFILLHLLDGWSYDKIGREQGKPWSTVRSKIRRGLEQLRNSMEKNGFDKNVW